jgi:hypothetical protein
VSFGCEYFEQMKGEKELIEKILQTEIYLFSSMRDGKGILHHREDFYYITLLEVHGILLNDYFHPVN